MLDGWKETELASKLGRTPSWVSERLSELRTEILLQNGLFPPLTEAEDAALRDSIRHHGVLEPVLVAVDTEPWHIISGNNRLRITNELRVPCPMLAISGIDPETRREWTIMLNASRRQLTRQQRRKLVEHELMHDSSRSDRRIALICGVSHPTVAAVRTEIAESAHRWRELELPAADAPAVPASSPADTDVESSSTPLLLRPAATDTRRVDSIGRRQPARRRSTPPRERIIATADCPCCNQRVNIIRTGADTRIEHA